MSIKMNADKFQKTLIETLAYDNKFKQVKEKLLPIIEASAVNNVPQWEYALRSGQHWEDIELRVPVPLINVANKNEADISDLIRYVYEESEDYALRNILIRPRIYESEDDERVQNSVVFDKIEDEIIQAIRSAKYLIWIDVAWFTNEKLYNELLERAKDGVYVRIIVSDEEINAQMISKLKNSFDVVIVPHWGYKGYNRDHHKSCIIDMDYVMHGSYNWTQVANHNGETWQTSVDRVLVKKFADEFQKIYVGIKSGSRPEDIF